MASQLVVGAGYLAILVMWAAVVGTVDRRERFVFAGGVILVVFGVGALSGTAGAVVSSVGIATVVAAAVPLLLE